MYFSRHLIIWYSVYLHQSVPISYRSSCTSKGNFAEDTTVELLSSGTEDAKRCIDFAERLSKQLTSSTLNSVANDRNQQFASWLLQVLSKVIGENPDKYVWVKFYHVRCLKDFETNWHNYLNESNLSDNPMPWQHLTVSLYCILNCNHQVLCTPMKQPFLNLLMKKRVP